jgi:hypothetical protein
MLESCKFLIVVSTVSLFTFALNSGCESAKPSTSMGIKNQPENSAPEGKPAPATQEPVQEIPGEDPVANPVADVESAQSYRQRFGNWMKSAGKSGQSASSAAGKFVSDSWSSISESGSTSAASAAAWAHQTYYSMKEAGLTQATSSREWLLEEYNRPNTWEYKIIPVALADGDPGALSAKLNELGAERWECFSVVPADDGITLFLKRHPKSYLPNLPLTETLKLLSLMGHSNE